MTYVQHLEAARLRQNYRAPRSGEVGAGALTRPARVSAPAVAAGASPEWGARFRCRRVGLGLTAEALGHLLGVSATAVLRAEDGTRPPRDVEHWDTELYLQQVARLERDGRHWSEQTAPGWGAADIREASR